MQLLGIINLVTGLVLVLVGRNVSRGLPPSYQSENDDGFLQLLQSMGKLIGGAGVLFVIIGMVFIVIGI